MSAEEVKDSKESETSKLLEESQTDTSRQVEPDIESSQNAEKAETQDAENPGVTKIPEPFEMRAEEEEDKRENRQLWIVSAIGGVCGIGLVLGLVLMLSRQRGLRFLVIGDWGRNGQFNQTLVAQAMAKKADAFSPSFIISVGDNFYESGLNSAEDEQFVTSFSDVYKAKSLQVPWYAVLGNHDYGEYYNDTKDLKKCPKDDKSCYLSPLHQLNDTLRQRDWRWHCERWYSVPVPAYDLEIFMIDTNPFIQEYHLEPWADVPGGIKSESWEAQVLELESRLAVSTAAWKLVIGHHPVRNQHLPFNTPELMQNLEPILLSQDVQAYFSGHEHNLQYMHVENQSIHYIVSGAGSLTDYPADYWDNGGGRFQHQGSGFVACELASSSLKCDYIGLNNEILYQIRIPKDYPPVTF